MSIYTVCNHMRNKQSREEQPTSGPNLKPKMTESQEKGAFGESYVHAIVRTSWHCLINEIKEQLGYDFRVQDMHRGKATSWEFNVEVKTSTFERDQPGPTFRAPVDRGHIALWQDANIPVVLVCVDVGPPARAYWRLISPGDSSEVLHVDRRNIFGPASRDEVLAAIQSANLRKCDPARGNHLEVPLHVPIRRVAKEFYSEVLLKRAVEDHAIFGPIEFTWAGWKHLTRRNRSVRHIHDSLVLLPCVSSVIQGARVTSGWRPLERLDRGDWTVHRTLLAFDREILLKTRPPANVRVVIQRQIWVRSAGVMGFDLSQSKYRFWSVYETLPHEKSIN